MGLQAIATRCINILHSNWRWSWSCLKIINVLWKSTLQCSLEKRITVILFSIDLQRSCGQGSVLKLVLLEGDGIFKRWCLLGDLQLSGACLQRIWVAGPFLFLSFTSQSLAKQLCLSHDMLFAMTCCFIQSNKVNQLQTLYLKNYDPK
jgi:hypothetical protein